MLLFLVVLVFVLGECTLGGNGLQLVVVVIVVVIIVHRFRVGTVVVASVIVAPVLVLLQVLPVIVVALGLILMTVRLQRTRFRTVLDIPWRTWDSGTEGLQLVPDPTIFPLIVPTDLVRLGLHTRLQGR